MNNHGNHASSFPTIDFISTRTLDSQIILCVLVWTWKNRQYQWQTHVDHKSKIQRRTTTHQYKKEITFQNSSSKSNNLSPCSESSKPPIGIKSHTYKNSLISDDLETLPTRKSDDYIEKWLHQIPNRRTQPQIQFIRFTELESNRPTLYQFATN